MEQLSLSEAKRLSLIKWNHIVNNNGYCNSLCLPDEVINLAYQCGFCERHRKEDFQLEDFKYHQCDPCELGQIIGKCPLSNSLYNQYIDVEDNDKERLELAYRILQAIESINV